MKRQLGEKRTREIEKVITPALLGCILDELKAIRGLLEKQQAPGSSVSGEETITNAIKTYNIEKPRPF